jgi:hypothetical protein
MGRSDHGRYDNGGKKRYAIRSTLGGLWGNIDWVILIVSRPTVRSNCVSYYGVHQVCTTDGVRGSHSPPQKRMRMKLGFKRRSAYGREAMLEKKNQLLKSMATLGRDGKDFHHKLVGGNCPYNHLGTPVPWAERGT